MAGALSPHASSSEPTRRQRPPDSRSARPEHEGADPEAPAREVSGWRVRQRRPWVMAVSAIVPWMLASTIATVTMSADLAPRADQTELPELQSPPPPPPAAQPGHSDGDDVYFDPMELLAV